MCVAQPATDEVCTTPDAPITVHEFRTLNRCLDDAIAGAVTEYGSESCRESAEGEATRRSERLGFFTHELRNLINTATIAFEILETGTVGIGGSTSAVLRRRRGSRKLSAHRAQRYSLWPPSSADNTVSCMPQAGHCGVKDGSTTCPF